MIDEILQCLECGNYTKNRQIGDDCLDCGLSWDKKRVLLPSDLREPKNAHLSLFLQCETLEDFNLVKEHLKFRLCEENFYSDDYFKLICERLMSRFDCDNLDFRVQGRWK